MRKIVVPAAAAALVLVGAAGSQAVDAPLYRSLDGSGNNLVNPSWGKAGTPYARVATPPLYADGKNAMQQGPPLRAISNRVFNDVGQDLFSERSVSQMGWAWGQFIDHTLDLRDESVVTTPPSENPGIPFDRSDPLETFTNDFPTIDFARTPARPGTGTSVLNPREQNNTVNSYISAWNVYGGTNARLDWLRQGSLDGNPENNSAKLLLPGNNLPRATARGDAANAPAMDLMGPLVGNPAKAAVAGDVRANENIGLTALQTLFAREHNRIVAALPSWLDSQTKFQIARRFVGAEQQYITYNEFLPSMGVTLPQYTGYKTNVDATISNEFATVGFRAHSQIHGEIATTTSLSRYTADQLAAFAAMGIDVQPAGNQVTLVIPLALTFGNPDLLDAVGVGPVLKGLALEAQYKNDEQITDSLRSVLFQIPKEPTAQCLGTPDPACFSVVSDLGAIDVARGRDQGIPLYNDLRAAYGLPRLQTFTQVTGELTDAFPTGVGPNDPSSLDFTQLRDLSGNVIPLGTEAADEDAVNGLRGSTLAARLKSIYGTVDNIDPFVGMVSEPHVTGSELGPLQLAIWRKQFQALRDGDRFFYGNDAAFLLGVALNQYGIDYRKTLAEVIAANAGTAVPADAFKAAVAPGADTVGLVASYGLDEGTGTTAADASGWGNDGTTRDTAWVPGRFGNALSFNGSSSWVSIPGTGSLDLTGGATLEAWVKPAAIGTRWLTVAFKERPGGMIYSLYAAEGTGRPLGQIGVGGERNVRGPASLPLNAWSYLATTFDGSTQTLYVDGQPVATNAQTGPIEVSEGALRLGGNSIWSEWFAGAIDEVRIYNRPLSQQEIATDMTTPVAAFQPRPPVAPALIGTTHVQVDSNPLVRSGFSEAYPTTVQANGTVANLRVFADAGTTATRLLAGIYGDNGGHPGTLLTAGTLSSPLPGAWNTVAVAPVRLAAGTTVWIALLGRGGLLGYRNRCCTASSATPTESNADTALTALPATWTTGQVYDDGPISAYGSG